jgi:Mg2+-importing ATPase
MNKEIVSQAIASEAIDNKRITARLPELCSCAPEEALVRLQASRSGLTEEQVEARREQYGPNEVTHEKVSAIISCLPDPL